MSRRKHRRRNPSNQTILYVGLGIAAVGVVYLLTKSQQAPAPVALPATQPAPVAGSDLAGQAFTAAGQLIQTGASNYSQTGNVFGNNGS